MIRFWLALLASFAATASLLAGAAYALSTLLVTPPPAKLRTATFEMDLAPGWSCQLQEAEYVCNPPGDPPYDSIAIIAAKYRNADDTLDAYQRHIETPQPSTGDERPGRTATVEYVRRRQIAGYEWVEGLQFGSELPTYYTYYLGTVTSHIGMLVTFSADASVYQERRAALQQMLESLVVYQRPTS